MPARLAVGLGVESRLRPCRSLRPVTIRFAPVRQLGLPLDGDVRRFDVKIVDNRGLAVNAPTIGET